MSIAGTWDVTIQAPTGPEKTVLVLEDAGKGKLGGSQTGRGVTTEVSDGRFDGREVEWVQNITRPLKVKARFSGVLEQDGTITGKVKVGFMPGFKFTAVRAKG